MELFAKIVNDWKSLTILPKRSILDVWQGFECASGIWIDSWVDSFDEVENSETSKILEFVFHVILNPSFWFWLSGKIENWDMRKLGIIFPRFPRVFASQLFQFSEKDLQYSKVDYSVRIYIYIIYCFQSLLNCIFLLQNYKMIKITPCCNKLYLLWDVSINQGWVTYRFSYAMRLNDGR